MASAQKGLMAMSGLSFIIGREDIIKASQHYPTRSYYCNLYLQYEYFERRARCISRPLSRPSMPPYRP